MTNAKLSGGRSPSAEVSCYTNDQLLLCFLAHFCGTRLATSETFYFPIRINRGCPARFFGAPDLFQIVFRAVAHPTLNICVLVFNCPSAGTGTKDLSILISFTLTLAAHYISILIFHAIGVCTKRKNERRQQDGSDCIFQWSLL